MDETELEDGEACAYQEDDDASIDPDVTLSYIDDKIQNVLGHFKKDFEGVVSVENLGAKYGIYGSFLPTYRRSPIWSHSKTPPRVQNQVASQSPNIVQVEGGHQHSLEQANAPPSVRCEYSSSADHKPPSQNDLCGQTTRIQSMQYMKECTPESEVCDHKTLKVRIKLGSDQLSGKKSAAIYSGLGLDGSPSSFEDSPVESRVLSHGDGMLFKAHESPTQILQMMTSFLLYGGYLLSPLPYDLIELSERPEDLQGMLMQTSLKANLESSVIGQQKDSNASYGDSVLNLLDRKGLPLQVKSDGKDSHAGLEFLLKKSDIDAACEELILDALKLPLLSSADSMFEESAEDSLKEKDYSRTTKREPLETSLFDGSLTDEAIFKGTSVKNSVHNEVADASSSGRMDNNKGEAADRSTNTDTMGSQSKKASKSKVKELRKQKGKNSLSCEGGKNMSSSGNKKKPKKSKAHGFATSEEAMESPKGCAWKLKERICTDSVNQDCRSESKTSLMQKQLSKVNDKYKDFFGELNELEADLMDSPDIPSKNRLKTLEVIDEAMLIYENASRERTSPYDISRAEEAGIDLKGSPPNVASSEDGWPITDPASSRIKMHESWVCCDKCHKKRLLPSGAKVDSLPKKWNCSMMTWLPDMNNCSISGEETTKSLRARYWLPPEIPNGTPVPYERLQTAVAAADISDPRIPKDGKLMGKKRKMSMPSFQESPNQFQSSVKKKRQLEKDRTVVDAKESPLINVPEFDHLTKSDDTFVETNQHNKIDKQKADCDSDGGHAKISMLESKRELDRDCPRISKKRKTRGIETGNNGLATAPNEGNEVLHVSSDYGFTTCRARNEQKTNSEFVSSQTSKDNLEDGSPNTNDKSTSPGIVALNDSKSGGSSVALKKKKNDHFQDPQDSDPPSGTLISDDEHFKKEKHRVSKSEGKEHSVRNGKADKRVKSMLRHSMSNTESFRNDTLCADPVLAPTFSSSKVSGSLKAKAYAQGLKGTPVQSVDDDKEMPKCNSDEGKFKASEFCGNPQDQKPVYEKKETARKIEDQEKCGSNVGKTEKDIIYHKPEPPILKSKVHLEYDEMRSSMNVDAEKKPNNLVSTSKREKSLCLKPSNREQNEMPDCPQKYLGNGMSSSPTDASASTLSKELKPNKKAGSRTGAHHIMSMPTISKAIKNQDAASPLRREASSEAARNALKEARNLKHIADRLKKSNGSTESTKFYFEAAIKFLHGASLLESEKTEDARHADMAESMKIYTSTAKLCEFCAHEYETSKDMATAALAYKCMEVAYMRVIRISHESACRDRRELQTVLRIVPPGESPSSSASDIDNLNNSVTGDKAPQTRSSDSPQLATDLVITTRNCPNFERLLSFAQNVNLAMEASRKSRIAFTAANGGMDQLGSKEGITSVKRALDFNFHDVDGLLRLVRLAKDVTSD